MIPFYHKAFVSVAHFAKIWKSNGSPPPTYVRMVTPLVLMKRHGPKHGKLGWHKRHIFSGSVVISPQLTHFFSGHFFRQWKCHFIEKNESAKRETKTTSRVENARAVPRRACLLLLPLVPRRVKETNERIERTVVSPTVSSVKFSSQFYTNSTLDSGFEACNERTKIDHRIFTKKT